MPSQLLNPLVAAGGFLAEETEKAASGLAFDRLFEGSTREMADRWAGTAVLDSAGKWHVVQTVDPVQDVAPKRRVKLFSGGSFGRGRFQDADWFKANAVKLYLGALQVPDGVGKRAVHRVDGQSLIVVVSAPEERLPEGEWAVQLSRDGMVVCP